MNPNTLIIQAPFSSALAIKRLTLEAIQENINEKGFDPAHPIVIWKEKKIVIDGHTRREAAILCGIEDVPVIEHSFPGELEALEYIQHHQEFRRQNDDGVILRMVQLIDEQKQRGGDVKSEAAKSKASHQAIDPKPEKSATITAAKIGTSRDKVEKARSVITHADEPTKQAVLTGEMSINAASKAVAEKKKADIVPSTKSLFNSTNDSIEWAKWSWNPITGCKYGCEYCYAHDIGIRFTGDFEPRFHENRFSAPMNTKLPASCDNGQRNVFVCSMADMFGDWVPQDWIDAILAVVWGNPKWNFLFLTKNPKRMIDIEWPDNAWVGTTVDRQSRVIPAQESFAQVKASVKFLSCEPMLEQLNFTDMSMFDWVIIGSRSKNTKLAEFQPEWLWVEALLYKAREFGCKVYFKPNLHSRPVEYPAGALSESASFPPVKMPTVRISASQARFVSSAGNVLPEK
ncbi:MAG: DUF5131 family protein [Candidatus Riflebacteria bacterium]|nr:DUF5131 family protein [Candidatus Riflebacteria bacterium]